MPQNAMTTSQRDNLQKLARRLHAAALAVQALGDEPVHEAVEELVLDIAYDLEAIAG